MGALIVAVALLVVFLVQLKREPRRLGNGVYLLMSLAFLALWLLTLAEPQTRVLVVGAVVLIAPVFVVVIALFLIANGVTLLRREGFKPGNALSFGAGTAILGVVGGLLLVLLSALREGSPEPWVLAAAGSLFLLAGYLGFAFTLFLLYSVLYGRVRKRTGHTAIVVLGAGVPGGRVTPLLAGRLDRALKLYRRAAAKGASPLVVASGGQGPDEPASEAEVMANYLRERGIPDEALLEERESTSTWENLRLSSALLAERGVTGRLLVVTSSYHVPRAAILSRRAGLKADVRGGRTAWYFVPNAFLREFAALLVQYRTLNALAACTALSVFPLLAYGV